MKSLKLKKNERTFILVKEAYIDNTGNTTICYQVFNKDTPCGKGFITFYNTELGEKAKSQFLKRYNK